MTWRRENCCPYRDSKSDPSVVQPVASPYTECAIPAHYIVSALIQNPKKSEGLFLTYVEQEVSFKCLELIMRRLILVWILFSSLLVWSMKFGSFFEFRLNPPLGALVVRKLLQFIWVWRSFLAYCRRCWYASRGENGRRLNSILHLSLISISPFISVSFLLFSPSFIVFSFQ
jgi:hypothetical protein